jgi:ribulose-phosphate 3-epimerase
MKQDDPQKPVEISASIMCIDWLDAGRQLEALHREGVDRLHWDIIDGRFAPDFTMGSSIINRFRQQSTIASDYHLMVEEPSQMFDAFEISEGDTFTIHQECCRNLHRDIVTLRRKGAEVGVALCPGTPLSVLDYIIEDIDYILIMTVNPGYMGQQLVPQTIRKIADLKDLIRKMELDIRVGVDGNVNMENVPNMVAAGADVLVAGSSGLFRNDMPLEDALKRLRGAIDEGLRRR